MSQRLVAKRDRQQPHRASPKSSPRVDHHLQSSMEGVYANPILTHTLTTLLGCVVDVHLQSGLVYQGILRAISPQLDVVLEVAHIENKPPSRDNVFKTVEVKFSDIVSVSAKADANPTLGTKDVFKTDSEISRCNGPAGSKELQPFHFEEGADGPADFFHESQEQGWSAEAMFSVNEEKFQVSSSYDEEMLDYTTKLSRSDTEQFRHRVERAAQLASEIEAKDMSHSPYQIDDVGTEEEMFSAVIRQPEAPPPQPETTPTQEPHPPPSSVNTPQTSETHKNGASDTSPVTGAAEPSSLDTSVPSGGREEGEEEGEVEEEGGGCEGGEAGTSEPLPEVDTIKEKEKSPEEELQQQEGSEAPSEVTTVSEDSGLGKADLPVSEDVGGAKEEVKAEEAIRKFKLDPNAREFKLDPTVKEFVLPGAVSTSASPSPVTALTNSSRTSPSHYGGGGHGGGGGGGGGRGRSHKSRPPRAQTYHLPEAAGFQMSPVSSGGSGYAFATPPPAVSATMLRAVQQTSTGQMVYSVPQYPNAGAYISQLPQQQILGAAAASGKVYTDLSPQHPQQYLQMTKQPLLAPSVSAPLMQPTVSQPQPVLMPGGGVPQQMVFIPGSSSTGAMQVPTANMQLPPPASYLPTGQAVMPQQRFYQQHPPAGGK